MGYLSTFAIVLLATSVVLCYDTEKLFVKYIHLKPKDIVKSLNHAETQVDRMRRFEKELSSFYKKNDEPFTGHVAESQAQYNALEQAKGALVVSKATEHLMSFHCSHKETASLCAKSFSDYKILMHNLGQDCTAKEEKCSEDDYQKPYRSYDGSCNNPMKSGKSFSPYRRLIAPSYLNGISTIRRSITKMALPSPRLISNIFHVEDKFYSYQFTEVLPRWTEFIAHDLSYTASSKTIHTKEQIECCDSQGTTLAPRHKHAFCLPITVPDDDPIYSNFSITCLPYVRSSLGFRPGCTLGANEQINQATHFLDGSQIYGSTEEKAMTLRTMKDGRLKTRNDSLTFAKCKDHLTCWMESGDDRVNSNPHLTLLHTIFVREHNRIANIFQSMNEDWDDEKLYQEARRVVIAEIQHITFQEWLPTVVGQESADSINSLNFDGADTDPKIGNAFANSAMRFFMDMLDNEIKLIDENNQTVDKFLLQNYYNKPIMFEKGNSDLLLRGMVTQFAHSRDMIYDTDVATKFYENDDFGIDVLSLDIQRGRDHGLPPYNSYRKLCGLKEATNFDDFLDTMPSWVPNKLRQVYSAPADVDLFVGAMLEYSKSGTALGITFSCIIEEQMRRTKLGDKKFYSNPNQPYPFKKQQLDEIAKVTLARVFCDNGHSINNMQKSVFQSSSKKNEIVNCSEIPKINFQAWEKNESNNF